MIYINNYYYEGIFLKIKNTLHRLNGPAVINEKRQIWYQNGLRHRLDGPAVIGKNRQEWYRYGALHRLDGPAIINIDYRAWYHNGMKYSERSYHDKLKEMGMG